MKSLLFASALAFMGIASSASAEVIPDFWVKVQNLKYFTTAHPSEEHQDVLVVTTHDGVLCNGKRSYALDISDGRNREVSQALQRSRAAGRLVGLEVDDEQLLAGGRCMITLVTYD